MKGSRAGAALAWLVWLWHLPVAGQAQGIDESTLLPVEEAFKPTVAIAADGRLQVDYAIAEGYYLYRERLKFNAAAPVTLSPPVLPTGQTKDDPNLGVTEVYHHAVRALLPVQSGGADALHLTLGYQGCAEAGICYPPQKLDFTLALLGTEALSSGVGLPPVTTAPTTGLALPGVSSGPALLPGTTSSASTQALVDDALPAEQAFRFEAIASDDHTALVRFTMAPGYYLYRDKTSFALGNAPEGSGLGLPRWPESRSLIDDHFGEVAVYFDVVEVPLEITRPAGGVLPLTLSASFQGCKQDGICYPVMARTLNFELPAAGSAHAAREVPPAGAAGAPPAPAAAAFTWGALLWALLAAVLGGLILNLMPCVLPILSLKALSLAQSGHSRSHARSQALWYTAGVLASFAAVGVTAVLLRNAGQAAGWGFQLQNPAIVAALVLVMTLVGLSLSGVVTFGNSLMGVGQSLTEDSGRKGAFFTGVLAVVVASPCTAPFMFGALGFAFAQPPALSLLVFLFLGLGLALPFLLIGFVPALASRLPKPGAWMESFKQWLAWPMYITAIWLVWVVGSQRGTNGMAVVLLGCVLLAAAAWWWERIKYGGGRGRAVGLVLVTGLAVGAVASVPYVHRLPVPKSPGEKQAEASAEGYEMFSPSRLQALLAEGRPVLVNMTADWCATCKVNEATSLSTDAVKQALKDSGTVYLKGDWTNADPDITAFLTRFHAVGVPLYVSFRKGDGEATVLPTVLTPGLVVDAVKAASGP